jgi:hypothetical protein
VADEVKMPPAVPGRGGDVERIAGQPVDAVNDAKKLGR